MEISGEGLSLVQLPNEKKVLGLNPFTASVPLLYEANAPIKEVWGKKGSSINNFSPELSLDNN